MRRNLFLLLAVVLTAFLAGSVWGEATLEVKEATLVAGSSGNSLILSMDNPTEDVAACGVEITFDTACFTVTDIKKTSRSATMDVVGYMKMQNGIKIAMTGIGHSIAAGSGPIAEIAVDVGDCAEGSYMWDVTVAVVADPNAGYIDRDDVDNSVTIVKQKSGKGDLNGDGTINVVDVLAVVNHILQIQPLTSDALICADCSGDKEIDIRDALGIVNVILDIGRCE